MIVGVRERTVRKVTVPALNSWVKQDLRASSWKYEPTWQDHSKVKADVPCLCLKSSTRVLLAPPYKIYELKGHTVGSCTRLLNAKIRIQGCEGVLTKERLMALLACSQKASHACRGSNGVCFVRLQE